MNILQKVKSNKIKMPEIILSEEIKAKILFIVKK